MRPNDLKLASEKVEAALSSKERSGQAFQGALDAIARAFDAVTATLHRADPVGETLHLLVFRGLPERVVEITRAIPFGKGMAGLCALRREPITVCNLQTDSSGAARPGARETGVAGAIVVPVLGAGGALLGTLGIGKAGEHTYSAEELAVLDRCARAIARALSVPGGTPEA